MSIVGRGGDFNGKGAKSAANKVVKKNVVVAMTIEDDYAEGPTSLGMFGDMKPSLATLVQRIDAAAADKNVAAVWLKIDDLDIGRAKVYELRGAMARLRKAHKPVYAELTTADARQYMLASACDRIVMPPVRRLDHSGRSRRNHLLQGPAR